MSFYFDERIRLILTETAQTFVYQRNADAEIGDAFTVSHWPVSLSSVYDKSVSAEALFYEQMLLVFPRQAFSGD